MPGEGRRRPAKRLRRGSIGEGSSQDEILAALRRDTTLTSPSETLSLQAQALLCRLTPSVRQRFLSERWGHSRETLGKSLLETAISHGDLTLVKFLVEKMDVEPYSVAGEACCIMQSMGQGWVHLVRYFVNRIGLVPDLLRAWARMRHHLGEKVIREVLEILTEHGLVLHDATTQDMWNALYERDTDSLPVQVKLMFEAGVPYIDHDFAGSPFLVAAAWGMMSTVELFLTGTLHTPEQAATALELLEVGYLHRRRILPLRPEGLSFFRRAQEIRDTHGIERRAELEQLFSSMEDIENLELDINEGHIINFIIQCYALCWEINADRAVFEDRAHVYGNETFVFFYLTSFDEVIDMFGRIEPEHRRYFGDAFQLALGRLVLTSQPCWREMIEIFYELRTLDECADLCDGFLKGLDMDELRKQFLDAPPMAASLVLSYVADVMLNTDPRASLRVLITTLLAAGAQLDFTREDHCAAEQQFWPVELHDDHERDLADDIGHPQNALEDGVDEDTDSDDEDMAQDNPPPLEDNQEEGAVAQVVVIGPLVRPAAAQVDLPVRYKATTLLRLLCCRWNHIRAAPVLSRIISSACCSLDAKNHRLMRSPNRVLRLECLVARVCPRHSLARLSGPLRIFVEKHRPKSKRDIASLQAQDHM
ncbi:hypothetical protein BIW11_06571 [Tropilaelaps mercedesae]|uniref:Uncharacterized protein n=1 Tax=Tropilaelaps mercedesae TaxID=418985 RepID=A0A1V9XXG0_9ACAR|nr:hypothetical protein BIW11_06571 [Tropilaelaps mercedesae]OQR78196.1 hypothetical protein BIW11_06571 [Tropilaelaps mercedesae]